MQKICLLGLGRTGIVVAEELNKNVDFDLVSVVSKPGSSKSGRRLAEFITGNNDLVIKDATALQGEIKEKQFTVAIDFTSPEASLKNVRVLAKEGINVVVGTTGFNKMQIFELQSLAQQNKIGLVYAPNISVGINLLLSIAKTIARLIPHYDIEIMESCHRNKKDSPSGTALKIAEDLNAVKGIFKGQKISMGRKGNKKRDPEEIGIHSIRAGGIAGVHQVLFAGEADEIEITHRSYSRMIYAEGALKAAAFIERKTGFYHMEEVLLEEEKVKRTKSETKTNKAPYRIHLNCH